MPVIRWHIFWIWYFQVKDKLGNDIWGNKFGQPDVPNGWPFY